MAAFFWYASMVFLAAGYAFTLGLDVLIGWELRKHRRYEAIKNERAAALREQKRMALQWWGPQFRLIELPQKRKKPAAE